MNNFQANPPLKHASIKHPESGPRILFFSGGTAINPLCETLKRYTHNSIHLVTPFDSGGSSASLRQAFDMPSVGDLRNRIIALANETDPDYKQLHALFSFRLPNSETQESLLSHLKGIAQGKSDDIAHIKPEIKNTICTHLNAFVSFMPKNFNLKGASIGNLILTGGYLQNGKKLEPVITHYSRLMDALGTVRTSINDNLHLMADLENGTRLFGQHALTGKELPPISSPIAKLRLSSSSTQLIPVEPTTPDQTQQLIKSAQLICYPPGSFYTSMLANLLPSGICTSIGQNPCPKVFIPNLGNDPEQLGKDINCLSLELIEQLTHKQNQPTNHFLNAVLVDTQNGIYQGKIDRTWLEKQDIELIDCNLISTESSPYYDNTLLIDALYSLL